MYAEKPVDLTTLRDLFLMHLQFRNVSPTTIYTWTYRLGKFIQWCDEREVREIADVTAELLLSYRRYLFHYRNAHTGKPLKFSTQCSYLIPLRSWFTWLHEEGLAETNPAEKLELPKEERRLPGDVLTASEVERMLNATDTTRAVGIRDRAMLETFYCTAMRCGELAQLQVYDLEFERGVIKIRQGKGRKDRIVPVGDRAQSWIEKYLHDVRPNWVAKTNENTLFVSVNGRPFLRNNISFIVRGYLDKAEITKKGSCHLIRHSAATLMMENGADIRALQMLLGHEKINSTQIYTHVSIQRLKEVHRKTHPAAKNQRE